MEKSITPSTSLLEMSEKIEVKPEIENILLNKLSEIEKTAKQTQKEMQEFIALSRANR